LTDNRPISGITKSSAPVGAYEESQDWPVIG